MSGTPTTLLISDRGIADADALMEECDQMERELGVWLAVRATQLKVRRGVTGAGCARIRSLRPSLWRALIQIWATSPDAKARFSGEARNGLISAATSMDSSALMCLVGGLLEEGASRGAGPAAA